MVTTRGAVMLDDPLLAAQIINESSMSTDAVLAAFKDQHAPLMAELVKWTAGTQGLGTGRGRIGGLFERDRYVTPENPYEQMRVAYDAAESDDVVGSVLDASEALAISKLSIDTEDEDEADIWNQIAEDIDLETRIREMWREMFIVSQVYCAVWFGTNSYKVQGRSQKTGIQRKRQFSHLTVPQGITILDPLKIVPVGSFLFNKEVLCYVADRTEQDAIDSFLYGNDDPTFDPIIAALIVKKYEPEFRDRKQLANFGIDVTRLYVLNPRMVFRHSATRSQYQRLATIRMKSVFETLDLKNQLKQQDRAVLIGGTNFIVLIKKGSDKEPAKQVEIDNLNAQVRTVARVPVIVGDHRLSVEIVTPKQDQTLSADRYAVVNQGIEGRLYGMFISGQRGQGARADDSIKLARVIGRGLESHRYMLRRSIERAVLETTYRANEQFTNPAKIVFHPRRIALDFDPALATYLLDLRDRGDLSRDSILAEVDYDQADEARKRKFEQEHYDTTFVPTNVPFSAPGPAHQVPVGVGGKPNVLPGTDQPAPNVAPHSHAPTGEPVALPQAGGASRRRTATANPKSAGRNQGGTRNGGGAAPGTGQGQPARRPNRKSDGPDRSRTRATAELDDDDGAELELDDSRAEDRSVEEDE